VEAWKGVVNCVQKGRKQGTLEGLFGIISICFSLPERALALATRPYFHPVRRRSVTTSPYAGCSLLKSLYDYTREFPTGLELQTQRVITNHQRVQIAAAYMATLTPAEQLAEEDQMNQMNQRPDPDGPQGILDPDDFHLLLRQYDFSTEAYDESLRQYDFSTEAYDESLRQYNEAAERAREAAERNREATRQYYEAAERNREADERVREATQDLDELIAAFHRRWS
jgi:hypothetical protein